MASLLQHRLCLFSSVGLTLALNRFDIHQRVDRLTVLMGTQRLRIKIKSFFRDICSLHNCEN